MQTKQLYLGGFQLEHLTKSPHKHRLTNASLVQRLMRNVLKNCAFDVMKSSLLGINVLIELYSLTFEPNEEEEEPGEVNVLESGEEDIVNLSLSAWH